MVPLGSYGANGTGNVKGGGGLDDPVIDRPLDRQAVLPGIRQWGAARMISVAFGTKRLPLYIDP